MFPCVITFLLSSLFSPLSQILLLKNPKKFWLFDLDVKSVCTNRQIHSTQYIFTQNLKESKEEATKTFRHFFASSVITLHCFNI